jgi:hypothetical protein
MTFGDKGSSALSVLHAESAANDIMPAAQNARRVRLFPGLLCLLIFEIPALKPLPTLQRNAFTLN